MRLWWSLAVPTLRWLTNNTSLWLHKILTIIEQIAKYFFLPLNWEMSSLLSISGNLSDWIGNYHWLQKTSDSNQRDLLELVPWNLSNIRPVEQRIPSETYQKYLGNSTDRRPKPIKHICSRTQTAAWSLSNIPTVEHQGLSETYQT